MTHATTYARLAAAHAADQRDPLTAEREIQDGNDVCHRCGGEFDENDLWHAGPDGDGEPTCARCVMGRDPHYKRMRVLLEVLAALLDVREQKTQTSASMIREARELLEEA